MKRLLLIGSGIFIFSIFPIIAIFLLSIILNMPNLTGVYPITFPLQYVALILKSIFVSGANIKKVKENNNNSVPSGAFIGIGICFIILSITAVFVDKYISFMNMDIGYYKSITLYYIGSIFINYIFFTIIEKLNFDGKEKQANIHSIVFNSINLLSLILVSLITKSLNLSIIITLILLFIYAVIFIICNTEKFKFEFNFLSNIKYESAHLCSYILMLLIYLFGVKNAFSAGQNALLAISFVSLITDAQWDASDAVSTATKIDIVNINYNHKKSIKNGYLYTLILMLSSIIMFISLYPIYKVNLTIALLSLSLHLLDFIIYLPNQILSEVIQLRYSPLKNTIIILIIRTIRVLLATFLPFALCLETAQVIAACIWLIIIVIMFKKNFTISKDGSLMKKEKNTKG